MLAVIEAKKDELRKNGSFNHHADAVSEAIFQTERFFDPYDLMQVKYEMLRAVEKGKRDVSSVSGAFGFSRVSYYQIKKEFDENGVAGLAPKKRGPKGSRKISQDDVEFARSLVGTHEGANSNASQRGTRRRGKQAHTGTSVVG